jgi:outer membrane receptor protein involved in Fe transport
MLSFELQGFQTLKRENIRVTQGTTLSIDVHLQVAKLSESVTVTSAAPVVDTTTTKVGADFSGQALVGVPSSTDLWGTLAQTPGIRMQGFDVGGSHKSQQVGYDAFGIRGQTKTMFEGIDNTEGDSGEFFYSDYYAVNEVSVTAVGGDVETSAPGATNIQTFKSGGNTFSGLEQYTYEAGSFVGNNIDAATAARGYTGNPNLLFWETHLDLGGPILRDKLWFYGAYNEFRLDQALSGVDPSVATDITKVSDPMLKVTWKASTKNTFVGFLMPRNYKQKPNRNLSASTSPDSVLAQASKTWIKKIEWQRIWSNRMFMDVRAAACCEVWPMATKVDAAVDPPRMDTATQLVTGAGWNAYNLNYGKPQTLGNITYFLPTKHAGSHDMKFGYEYIFNHYRQGINGQSGPIQYLDRNGQPNEIQLIDVGTYADFGNTWQPGYDDNTMFSLYAQDRWTPTARVTLTAGLRYGYQHPHYEEGTRDPVLSDVFPKLTVPATSLLTRNNVAPRLGLAYDVSGNGRTAVKAFYGRYYAIYGNSFTSLNPGGVNARTYQFNDLNGNDLYDGVQELGALVASSGGSSTTIDPNLKQPYTDEISGSIEHQFWGESSARILYVYKVSRNIFGLVNTARIGTETVPVSVANPFDPSQTIHALDIPSSLKGVVTNEFTNLPDSDASYHTLSLSAQHRFQKGLFIQGDFDYQWRNELRQPSGPSTSPLNTDPIGVYSFGGSFPIDYSADVSNRQATRNWQAHLLGRYELPYQIGVGVNLRSQSGFPYSPIANVKLPNAGTVLVFTDDFSNHYSPTVTMMDLRLDKTVSVGRYKVTGMLDAYNLTNANTITNFFLVNGSTYDKVIAALNPRTIQLGLRFTF